MPIPPGYLQDFSAIFDEAFENPWEGKHLFRYTLEVKAADTINITIDLYSSKKAAWQQVLGSDICHRNSPQSEAAEVLSRLLADHVRWS